MLVNPSASRFPFSILPRRSSVNYSMNLIVFHQCGSHTGLTIIMMMIMWKMNMQMGENRANRVFWRAAFQDKSS